MAIVVSMSIDADLECEECGHEWQETFYEEHVSNVAIRAQNEQCPKCKE